MLGVDEGGGRGGAGRKDLEGKVSLDGVGGDQSPGPGRLGRSAVVYLLQRRNEKSESEGRGKGEKEMKEWAK